MLKVICFLILFQWAFATFLFAQTNSSTITSNDIKEDAITFHQNAYLLRQKGEYLKALIQINKALF